MKIDSKILKTRILEIFIFMILIISTAFLFRLINNTLSVQMEALKREALSMMEKKIDAKIDYESISPSIFMFLEVRNLKIRLIEQPQNLLSLKTLRIRYNIFKLLFGSDPLNALTEIRISNTHFNLDWERDTKIIRIIERVFFSGPPKFYDIQISGYNLDLYLNYRGTVINADNIFFQLGGDADNLKFNLKKTRVAVLFPLKDGKLKEFKSEFKLKARFDGSMQWLDSQMEIYSFSSGYFTTNRQSFQISLQENELKVTKVKDKSPIDIQLIWNLENSDLALLFKSENLHPLSLISFTRQQDYLNEWLQGSLSGIGSLKYNLNSNNLDYNLQIEASINNRKIVDELHLNAELRGNNKQVFFDFLHFESKRGKIYFTGDLLLDKLLPQGSLRVINLELSNTGPINTYMEVTRNQSSFSMTSNRILWGDINLEDTRLTVNPSLDRINFSFLTHLANTSDSRIESKGSLRPGHSPHLKLNCMIARTPADQIYTISRTIGKIPFTVPLPNLLLTSYLELETDFHNLDLKIPDFYLAEINRPNNYLSLSGRLTNKFFRIDNIESEWNGYDAQGAAEIVFWEGNRLDFNISFMLQDYRYSLGGRYNPSNGVTFSGDYGINGYFRENVRGLAFGLAANDLPIPITDTPILVSLDISGSKGWQTEWLIISSGTSLTGLPVFSSLENKLDIAFRYHDSELEINNLSYQDEFSTLDGWGNIIIDYPSGYTGFIFLENPAANEGYTLDLNFENGQMNHSIDYFGSPLARLGRFPVSGQIGGRIQIMGSAGDPSIMTQFSLSNGRIGTDPVDIAGRLHYRNNKYTLYSFDLTHLGNKISNSQGWLDMEEGSFELHTVFNKISSRSVIKSDLYLAGIIEAKDLSSIESCFSEKIQVKMELRNITINDEEAPGWSIIFSSHEGRLFFDGGPGNALHGYVTSDIVFNLSLDEPLPITGQIAGKITNNTIHADFTDLSIAFPLLTLLIGDDIFSFTDGRAVGNLTISGLITDPDFFGELDAQGVKVSFYMAPDGSDSFDTKLLVREKEIYYGIARTRAGLAEILSEGVIVMERWSPASYDLSFWTEDEVGLHLIHDFGTSTADGFAAGRIRVRGDWYNTWVEGSLQINYCKITLNEKKPISRRTNSYDSHAYFFNMRLQAGKRVEFLWPSIEFPVIHTYANRGAEILISYNSDSSEMSFMGDVELKGGEVYYFDRSFYIKDGLIKFNETMEYFDPRISVQAEIREIDQENEEVKIYLIANNNRLSEFSPRFDSDPNKSDMEIIALLGGPIQSQIQESGIGVSALVLSTDILSQFGLFRPFEQKIREVLGLDLFSIRTQIIQNVVIDRLLGAENDSAGNDDLFPGNYLDNTTISFGKYIGNDLFLEMLLRFIGSGNTGLETELFISLEWPTPLFNLEWTIAPSLETLDELFLRDSALTFKWFYSY